jgi:hypothetical protein
MPQYLQSKWLTRALHSLLPPTLSSVSASLARYIPTLLRAALCCYISHVLTPLQLLPMLTSSDVRERLVFIQVLRACCSATADSMWVAPFCFIHVPPHFCLIHRLGLLPDLLLLLYPSASHNEHQLQLPSVPASLHPPLSASIPIESHFTCLRVITEARPPSLLLAFNSCAERRSKPAGSQSIRASVEQEFSDSVVQLIQLVCCFCTHSSRLVREDCVAGYD